MTEAEQNIQTEGPPLTVDDDGKEWLALMAHHQLLAWEHVAWREAVLDMSNAGTAGARMENWLGAKLASHEAEGDVTYAQFRTWTEPKYGPFIDEMRRQADDCEQWTTGADGSKIVKLRHPIGPISELILRPPTAADRERASSNLDNPLHTQLSSILQLVQSDKKLTMQHLAKMRIGDSAMLIAAYMSFR